MKFLEVIRAFIKDNKHAGLIISVLLFVFIVGITFLGFYDVFELKLYDLRFSLKRPIKQWDRLVFIDIDEASISALGEYPWPRDKYGDALKSLSDAGATMLGIDIMFPDKSPKYLAENSYHELLNKMNEGAAISKDDLKKVARDNDIHFAQNCESFGRAILSYTFNVDEPSEETLKMRSQPEYKEAFSVFLEKSSVAVADSERSKYADLIDTKATYISPPIPEIMKSGALFGFVNRYSDFDGVMRRVPLVNFFDGRLFFNLAIVMFADVCKIPLSSIEVRPGDAIVFKDALHPITFVKGDIVIPIDKAGNMYVNWAAPGRREATFSALSFFALIDYARYSPPVNDYFDRVENETGRKRSALYGEYDDVLADFNAETDPARKVKLDSQLKSLRSQIREEKLSYMKYVEDNLAELQKEYGETNNPALSEKIAEAKDDINAMKVVIMVEDLEDKICLSGLTAIGTHDIGAIPTYGEYARVGSYQNTINTIVQSDYIHKVPAWMNYALFLVLCLSIGIIAHKALPKYSLIIAGSFIVVVNAAVIFLFSYFGIWIDELGANLSVVLPSASIISIKLLNTESQRRFIKNAFSRYLSADVIEDIIKNPSGLQLGGESREITIFFSDVAKFSTMSEKLTPNELVARLNEYLSEMTDIILSYRGTVDKYEGDAIIAFYGAPHNLPEHPLNACLAAIDMKRKLRDLQDRWRLEGKDELHVRMGINTGIAVVGNMGSRNRMDYTAMGDSVNLASRLEGANKFYSSEVMISGDTYDRVGDLLDCRELDVIRVVGKDKPVRIYELLGKKGLLPQRVYDMLEAYNKGIEVFRTKDWEGARREFSRALELLPDDGPSKAYVDRCSDYILNPPPKNWDGVYSLKGK